MRSEWSSWCWIVLPSTTTYQTAGRFGVEQESYFTCLGVLLFHVVSDRMIPPRSHRAASRAGGAEGKCARGSQRASQFDTLSPRLANSLYIQFNHHEVRNCIGNSNFCWRLYGPAIDDEQTRVEDATIGA